MDSSTKKLLVYGFLIWLIPFMVAVAIFPLREDNRPLFESLMPVTLAAVVIFFSVRYLGELKGDYRQKGLQAGLVWMAMSILIDLPLFSDGPMAMSLWEYLADIGVTYLMMPVITAGCGHLLQSQSAGAPQAKGPTGKAVSSDDNGQGGEPAA